MSEGQRLLPVAGEPPTHEADHLAVIRPTLITRIERQVLRVIPTFDPHNAIVELNFRQPMAIARDPDQVRALGYRELSIQSCNATATARVVLALLRSSATSTIMSS